MEQLKVALANNRGQTQLLVDDQQVGEMEISVHNGQLTVYHTEVNPAYEGKGYAKLLLSKLVEYGRENNLKIVPLCPYVHGQFKRYPELYQDIWYTQKND